LAGIARQIAIEFGAACVQPESVTVITRAPRQRIGQLVGIVDAPLREVEDIDADWAEAGDVDLTDRSYLILGRTTSGQAV
jgi:hypothetical protein